MQTRPISYFLLLLSFFLIAYIFPLGARDLVIPDETRYGEIPREMIAQNEWIVPKLNGLRYFEKPVLGYWVHAASLLIFGENNFAVRFPSVLAVGLSALLVFGMVQRALRNSSDKGPFPATLAALVYLSCIEVFGVGNTAVLDSLFAFLVTASICAFHGACEAPSGSRREKSFLVLAGLGCGLGFLTKGFLALAVPVAAIVPFFIWERRLADIFRMSWIPILTACLVALPWGLAIHFREPDFWRFFFWNEHIRRFMASNAQHKESFWFFFLVAPAMFVPWTFLIPAAVAGIRDRVQEQGSRGRLIRFSLCWLIFPFLLFSLSKGKLLTYILPCFPPFAISVAFGLDALFQKSRQSRLLQGGILVNAFLFGLILIGFGYVQAFGFEGIRPFEEFWKAGLAATGVLCILLMCWLAYRSTHQRKKVLLFGMAPFLLYFVTHFTIPDQTIEAKCPGPFLEKAIRGLPRDVLILSDEESVTAVCWYLKRSDVYVVGLPGELDYGSEYPDAAGRLMEVQRASDLIRQNPGKTILISQAENILQWRQELPEPVFQERSGPSGFVLFRY
ncbi:phospholipid carrier-dependent glycosyltransferase [Desulfatirhabdium butyrativorans]|uniref:phospholipid carrier-dependent glycosyltransferase n=1 Tax=Desulfatirhabdium butyrativorans TaxID=340467 RepID=UPI0003F74763|nr:phospholipid carrier-dependent glycosyltransferase [Desulfatirhabdium butyrativorans]